MDPAARRRLYVVLVPMLGFLLAWNVLFWSSGACKWGPRGIGCGGDFAMFTAAAQVMRHGADPYDRHVLYRTEHALLIRNHIAPRMPNPQVVRVGNIPFFFWLLEPETRLPFQPAGVVWIVLMYLLSGAGFLVTLRYVGWRQRIIPGLIFLAMPQVVLAAFYGNNIGLVFVAVACGMAVAERCPFAAGMMLGIAWLKPQVAFAAVLLIVLFHTRRSGRAAAGFLSASVLLGALTLAATGWHDLTRWVAALSGYSHDTASQPDVASLTGLYVYWAPAPVRTALEVLSLALALTLTVLWWRAAHGKGDISTERLALLWMIWFLATPYAHSIDEMLLSFPILVMAGRSGSKVATPLTALALYALAASFFLNTSPPSSQVNLLPVALLLAALGLALARSSREARPRAEPALQQR